MVTNLYEEMELDHPHKYYGDLDVKSSSNLVTLLSSKELVLASEKMIQSWIIAFQTVSYDMMCIIFTI